MSPKEYIKDKLSKLAMVFPSITVRYAYNDIIETHVVELTPEYEYYHNKSLDQHWIPLSIEFQELYPREDITFISSDSSLSVINPEFEWNGEVAVLDIEPFNDLIQALRTTRVGVEFSDQVVFQKMPELVLAHDMIIGSSSKFVLYESLISTYITTKSHFECVEILSDLPHEDSGNDNFLLAA